MTTREKVILGITAVAAIGAGIYSAPTWLNQSTATEEPTRKDFTTLITSVQVKLKQGELTDREENILSAASNSWQQNPRVDCHLTVDLAQDRRVLRVAKGLVVDLCPL